MKSKIIACLFIAVIMLISAVSFMSPVSFVSAEDGAYTPQPTDNNTSMPSADPTLDPEGTFFNPDEGSDGARNSPIKIALLLLFVLLCLFFVIEAIVKYAIKAKERYDDKFK